MPLAVNGITKRRKDPPPPKLLSEFDGCASMRHVRLPMFKVTVATVALVIAGVLVGCASGATSTTSATSSATSSTMAATATTQATQTTQTSSTTTQEPRTILREQCHTGLPTLQITRASNNQEVALASFISRPVAAIAFHNKLNRASEPGTNELSGFVGTRNGLVYSFSAPIYELGAPARSAVLSPTPTLDLSFDTGAGFELGLYGMALSPNEDWLYLHRTTTDWHSLVTAHAVSGNTLGPAIELLRIQQPFPNHNGGDIVFGPKGYLHVSFGDGGSQQDPSGNGQNLGTPFGAILRLAVDPTAPPSRRAVAAPDNPYIGIDGVDDRIWVSGVRNPFRMTYDAVNQQLWVADVGERCMEEITVLELGEANNEGGADLGWSVFEGSRRFGGEALRPHRAPDFEYRQKTGTLCAVIGGQIYRGSALTGLVGHFVWTDLCARRIYATVVDDFQPSQRAPLAIDLGVQVGAAWGLVAAPTGEVFVIDNDFGIWRLIPA